MKASASPTAAFFPVLAWLLAAAAAPPTLLAQQPQPSLAAVPAAGPASSAGSESFQQLQQLITAIVRDNIPDEYEERKGWGDTTEVWAGLKVWQEGLQIKTKRRKKEVNHGTWKRYRIRLIDPENHFHVRVENLRVLPNGRFQFDTWVEAGLDAFGRISHWERGVQLISLSANAKAQVRLRVQCDLGVQLDPSEVPPAVTLDPVVTEADLQLVDFRLRRISDLHGPLVHELGKGLRDVVEDELAKRRRKLPEKINRQIDKNREDLRLSLYDVLGSAWGDLAAKHFNIPGEDASAGRKDSP
jgi:hypothetical protein